jgi:hypothetical protein
MMAAMNAIRRVGIAIGSLVIAALCVALVGWFVPQVLGPATNPVLAVILGALIYRDIIRRDLVRGARRAPVSPT